MDGAMPEPNLTIIYTLQLQQSTKHKRITIDLLRDNFKAPLGYFDANQTIRWLQPKNEFLFDEEDLKRIHKKYRGMKKDPVQVGSLELGLFTQKENDVDIRNNVNIRYNGEDWALWSPEKGLKCLPGSPPWIRKDAKYISDACVDIPFGRGLGVFSIATRQSGL